MLDAVSPFLQGPTSPVAGASHLTCGLHSSHCAVQSLHLLAPSCRAVFCLYHLTFGLDSSHCAVQPLSLLECCCLSCRTGVSPSS